MQWCGSPQCVGVPLAVPSSPPRERCAAPSSPARPPESQKTGGQRRGRVTRQGQWGPIRCLFSCAAVAAAFLCNASGTSSDPRRRCGAVKEPHWGGSVALALGVASSGVERELASLQLQECSSQGVCQWLGEVQAEELKDQARVLNTERGLGQCWHIVITAEFKPKAVIHWLSKSSRSAKTQVALMAEDATCGGLEGCLQPIGYGTTLRIQAKYHPPHLAPFHDPDLQRLGANFSAYAVKEFPYTSWAAPLHKDCLDWRLIAEHHDCVQGAHAGTWLASRPGAGPQALNNITEKRVVLVAFKGTDFAQLEEVYTDLQMQLVPCALGGATVGRCANGFYQAYQSIRGSIMDSLQVVAEELTGAEAELFVTGHSLGAAMATLFLADLLASPATLGFRPSQTLAWHYGSPMIGDASFRDRLLELEGAEDGGRAVNLRDHVRAVAVNSRGTTDFITHYPMCVVPPVAANLVWGTPPSEFHHVGRRHYLSFLNQEPLHVGEEDVPKERLMKEPGLQCLADLLVKGANWLHDERDNYLPMANSVAPGQGTARMGCSGRTGVRGQKCCSGTLAAMAACVALLAVASALAAWRYYGLAYMKHEADTQKVVKGAHKGE